MVSLHEVARTVFTQNLEALLGVLDKGRQHALASGVSEATLLDARLAPDMFPLVRQVQTATDNVKGSMARLAGREVPSWPDEEKSFADLDARVRKALDLVAATDADAFEGADTREVTMTGRAGTLLFVGRDYLLSFVLPNFFFHVTTAYAILRAEGVPLGKGDFLGTSGDTPPTWMRRVA